MFKLHTYTWVRSLKIATGNYYTMTMIDLFSKFVFLKTLRKVNSEEVCKMLDEILTRFPPPALKPTPRITKKVTLPCNVREGR